jgi:hypothetical protein
MEFRLLGPLEVLERDRLLPLGGGRQRALFVVRRGQRPGGLAPPETAIRFGWSLTAGAS